MKPTIEKLITLYDEFADKFGKQGHDLYDFTTGFLYMSACLLKTIDSKNNERQQDNWNAEVLSRFPEVLYVIRIRYRDQEYDSIVQPENFEDIGIDTTAYRAEKDLKEFAMGHVPDFQTTEPIIFCFSLLHVFEIKYFAGLVDNEILDNLSLLNLGVLELTSLLAHDKKTIVEHGATVGLLSTFLNENQSYIPVGYGNFVYEDGTLPTADERLAHWNRKNSRILFHMLKLYKMV